MGSCNCIEKRDEPNTATLDRSLKYSVKAKVQQAKEEAAVFDFDSSEPDPDFATEKRPQLNSEFEADFPLQKTEGHQGMEVRRTDKDSQGRSGDQQDSKEFLLGKLTPVAQEVFTAIGGFKYVKRAKSPTLVSLPLGDLYYGETSSDKNPHGFGLLVKSEGSVIEGLWQHGSIHGEGLQVYTNGDSYVGNFDRGEVSGHGKFVNYRGAIYDGQWRNLKQNGEGVETWTDGAVYTGHFVDGKKEGFGVFNWADEAKYEGEFLNNNLEGKGKYTWKTYIRSTGIS